MVLKINSNDPVLLTNEHRLTVSYYRTSTDSQDEAMQINAARATIQKLGLQNVLELNDSGVSANTVPLEQRQKLNVLLNLIREGRVEHLVVFSRDRLARDAFEYSVIQKAIRDHGVKVIFTMQNAIPFQDDVGMELLLSVFTKYEGQQIRNRTHVSNSQYPPKLFGYKKETVNGQKRYLVVESKARDIVKMFHECAQLRTLEEFAFFLVKHQKILKRKPQQLLNILQNPFYSGHMRLGGGYELLPYVEPMITLDQFLAVEEVVHLHKQAIDKAMLKPQFLSPVCAICGNAMRITGTNLITPGNFVCSNNHAKVSIQVEELEKETINVIDNFIARISIKCIESLTKRTLKKLLAQVETDLTKQRNAIADAYVQACLTYSPLENNSILEVINLVSELKKEQSESLIKRNQLEIALQETRRLVELLHKSLTETLEALDYLQLARLIIESIRVSNHQLHFSLYFKEFIMEEGAL
jgi:site-specific DNA recombinase